MRITEELLEVISLFGTMTGDIFDAVWSILEKCKLSLDKLRSVTTESAKSMTGENKGFASKLIRKLQAEYLDNQHMAFHCLIHQQVLCLKILKMDDVWKIITKTINFI
ncbi:general transcription factor II-I repeat domain-containing protein 2A-like [Lycorma delicatula]|uniref:general transcription factor II-I repeat domain-containing protein 2A-like n=1 Tax=Lycorma delicatula TaxID=130591 RepID=UPI003F50D740